MTDVSLIHTSGGLLGDVFTDSLREDIVNDTNRVLADVSGFAGATGTAPKVAEFNADVDAAFTSASALWSAYAEELAEGMDVSRLREKLVMPLLRQLGFDPQYQRSHLAVGGESWAISHLGWAGDPHAPPILVVADADLDDRKSMRRSPHEELQGYLNASPVRWGLVSNGRVLRILRDYHHTRTRGYVEIDLLGVFDSGGRADFLALFRLAHVSRFVPLTTDGEDAGSEDAGRDHVAATLLEHAYEQNLAAGVAAGRRLQPQVRAAIEALANGLADATPGLRTQLINEPDVGREFYREILTVLYRLLFLLLAEQRGMLRGASEVYTETYSLTSLRERVEAGEFEGRRRDLWVGLQRTFAAFSDPTLADLLKVYPYNGALFDLSRTPLTTGALCANDAVASAVRNLTTVQSGKVRLHIDYRNLGVEELGTVYESLLDYTLEVATVATAVPADRRTVAAGRIYLAPLSSERADLGAYYTPTDLVDLLLTQSLDPLITATLDGAADKEQQEQALLALKIIDPACGSAAILIGALDRLAGAVASVRTQPHAPRDHELAQARRDVLGRCIYGVDKDPFAVELAKVALWIHCVVPDQPLSFLDSRIVCGDALVGWPLLDLPTGIADEVFQISKGSAADKNIMRTAARLNTGHGAGQGVIDFTGIEGVAAARVDPRLDLPAELTEPDHDYADVRAKAQAFTRWQASEDFQRWKAAADLWTAAAFWTAEHGAAPTTWDYQQAVEGTADLTLVAAAAEVLRDLNPLHWPLAFPDVRAVGGFDLVLGNPPWEVSASIEQDFFAQAAPSIAAMGSEERKQAIDNLSHLNPGLFSRWAQYRVVQKRFAHFAKTSGRYTRTASKVNTYVLFTELAAEIASHAGLVVKSGIATDKAQSDVWKALLDDGRVAVVKDIVNSTAGGGLVFPEVAAVERFSTLTLAPAQLGRNVAASLMSFGVAQAATTPLRTWTHADLSAASPRTLSLLSSNSADEIDLALALQKRFDTLDFAEEDGSNPWNVSYHTLFNATHARTDGHALKPDFLVNHGFVLGVDKVFRHSDGRSAVPLFEGQMANRWDHRARTYEGYTGTNKYGRKPHIPWVTDDQHANPDFENEPRYWMMADVAEERIEAVAGDRWLLAMRDIGAVWTNQRSMRLSLLGRYPATHTLPVIASDVPTALAFLAVANSMTFDFLVRLHMPGGHVTPWIVSQCAAPPPDAFDDEISDLAAKLTVTSQRLADLTGLPITRWDPEERALLDAELDARVARAYRLSRDEYETVLDHFAPLRRAETKPPPHGYGEYRSKARRLDAYDKLTQGED